MSLRDRIFGGGDGRRPAADEGRAEATAPAETRAAELDVGVPLGFERRPASGNGTRPPAHRADTTEFVAPGAGGSAILTESTESTEDGARQERSASDVATSTDISFGYDISGLEKEASTLAREWAEKGLPRHDLAPSGRLEVEELLERRAVEVYMRWVNRVRRRTTDAIQQESERLGARLVGLEEQLLRYKHRIEALRTGRRELAEAEVGDAEAAAKASSEPKKRLAYNSSMGRVAFWLFMPLLVLADFVANVPVFNELLPSPASADRVLANWVADGADSPLGYGVRTFFGRLVLHLDATVLAFSVILFLVFLGHVLGGSLRTLVALGGSEARVDDRLLHEHRRRPVIPAWAAFVGIVATLTVLYAARAGIEPAAEARLAQTEAQVARADSLLAVARATSDLDAVATVTAERNGLLEVRAEREKRAEYAAAVGRMNLPVLGLNIVLVLCAMVAAYLRQSEKLEYEAERVARAPAARTRAVALRQAVEEQRARVLATSAEVDGGFQRLAHLAEARPLAEAESRAERLRSVVPRWRSENARWRGLDTRDVRAFEGAAVLTLPEVDVAERFAVPARIVEDREKYERLERELVALERDREALLEQEVV